jgi:thioredoxin-dependent peroxiredoxin
MNLFRIGAIALAFAVIGLTLGNAVLAQEKKLKVHDKAPAFEATDDSGKTWKSSDVVGKKILVLYFYPADFTGGCTAQACSYRDSIEKLGSKGVEVVGVSGDSVKTHEAFKKDHKLNFTLLADEKGEVGKLFGIPVGKGGTAKGKDLDGKAVDVVRGSTIKRWTVVIDKKGEIAAIDEVKKAGEDPARIAEFVSKLEK